MNAITQKTLSFKIAVLTAISPLLISPTPASAAFRNTCKDVDITIKNETGKMVKVYDIEYYNDRTGLWKNMIFKDRALANNSTWIEKDRNLKKVRDVETKVRIQYREFKNGRVRWKLLEKDSSKARCSHGNKFTVTLK